MANHATPTARCHTTAFGEAECTIPYQRELIARWKDGIPYRYRSYDPESKAWRFWGGYVELAMGLLLQYFPDADIPRRTRSHTAPRAKPPGTDHFAVLHLLPTAPREVVDAAFRAMAKIVHTDHGGTDAAMRRVIEAHDALSRRLSA